MKFSWVVQDTCRREMLSFRAVYGIANEADVLRRKPCPQRLYFGNRAEAGSARIGEWRLQHEQCVEALASAEPDSARDLMQELFVCKVALGSCELESEGGEIALASFGSTMHKEEILNRTNTEQTIFCCKYENQVVVEYRVQLRIALRASVDWGLLLRTQPIHHADVHAAIRAQSASSTVVVAQKFTPVPTEEVRVQVKGIKRIDTFRFLPSTRGSGSVRV